MDFNNNNPNALQQMLALMMAQQQNQQHPPVPSQHPQPFLGGQMLIPGTSQQQQLHQALPTIQYGNNSTALNAMQELFRQFLANNNVHQNGQMNEAIATAFSNQMKLIQVQEENEALKNDRRKLRERVEKLEKTQSTEIGTLRQRISELEKCVQELKKKEKEKEEEISKLDAKYQEEEKKHIIELDRVENELKNLQVQFSTCQQEREEDQEEIIALQQQLRESNTRLKEYGLIENALREASKTNSQLAERKEIYKKEYEKANGIIRRKQDRILELEQAFSKTCVEEKRLREENSAYEGRIQQLTNELGKLRIAAKSHRLQEELQQPQKLAEQQKPLPVKQNIATGNTITDTVTKSNNTCKK